MGDRQGKGVAVKTSRGFLKMVFASLTAFTVILALYVGAWFAVNVSNYIDVQSIDIESTAQGQPINMTVLRIISKDFKGGYRVEVRNSENGSFCTTGDVELDYEVGAVLKDPLELSYWAGGGSCQGRVPSELEVGLYSVKTCHFVKRPWFVLPRKERCVRAVLVILHKEVKNASK